MKNDIQYEIYIGCNDYQVKKELIKVSQLKRLISDYFKKKKINYSLQEVEGGYLYSDGVFIIEKTICITIIGNQDLDIIKFANGLSMIMNQECLLVTKNKLELEYR